MCVWRNPIYLVVFKIHTQEIVFEIYIILLQYHKFSCVSHYSESSNQL